MQDSTLGMHNTCQFVASLDLARLSASNYQLLASLVNKEMTEINDLHRLNCQWITDNAARHESRKIYSHFRVYTLQFNSLGRLKKVKIIVT